MDKLALGRTLWGGAKIIDLSKNWIGTFADNMLMNISFIGEKTIVGAVVVEVVVGVIYVARKSLDIRSVVVVVVEALFKMVAVVGAVVTSGVVVVIGAVVVAGVVVVAGALAVVGAVELTGELIGGFMTRKSVGVFMGLQSFLGPFLEPC